MRARTWLVAALVVAALALPASLQADGAWLDAGSAGPVWNRPGAPIPEAPPAEFSGGFIPRCIEINQRPAETIVDTGVELAGWTVVGSRVSGWGIEAITGASGFDGMCRWTGYQVFVFVDGVFAGTLSPTPMDSRSDGALTSVDVVRANTLVARFSRYTDADPLCCPSRVSTVIYTVNRALSPPIVQVESVNTAPAGS